MSKRYLTSFRNRILLLFIFLSFAVLPASSLAMSAKDSFSSDLSKLLSSRDSSHYFGVATLHLDESILEIDNKKTYLSTAVRIINGRTMMPSDTICEWLNLSPCYQTQTGSISLTTSWGDVLHLEIGSTRMRFLNQIITLDTAPFMENGTIYLPMRAIAEAMAMDVTWHQEARAATVTAPYQTARISVITDQLETAELEAESVLSDGTGMWILQYNSPLRAKSVLSALTERGITAEIDKFIP